MLLGWLQVVSLEHFSVILAAHAQLQVYGFVGLYTMGVAMMVLPTFLKTTLQPVWLAFVCLALMLLGVGFNLTGPTLWGGALQSLSTLAFLVVLRKTRMSAAPQKRESTPLTRGHAIYLATGSLWLAACPFLGLWDSTRASETVLWGFAGLYIAGIGLRVHPGILGIKGVYGSLLAPSVILWNLGLLLRWTGPKGVWPWVLGVGVLLFVWALRPFRRPFISAAGAPWLRYFVRTSYFWLLLSVGLACSTVYGYPSLAGPTRHMLGSGFVVTMMMGMGLRMIPAFETLRLTWSSGPWVVYALITLGTAIRVPAQAYQRLDLLALGGGLQFLGIMTFIGLMLTTYLFGKRLHCDPKSTSPTEIFEEHS